MLTWSRAGLPHRGAWLMAHYARLCRGYRHLRLFPNPLLAFLGWGFVCKRRDLLIPRYIASGTACDYGCGSCGRVAFLRYCGWHAEGIDFSEAAATAGRKAGLAITHGSIATLEDRPAAYDFIHYSHCVEHVPDVQRLVCASARCRSPAGRLPSRSPVPMLQRPYLRKGILLSGYARSCASLFCRISDHIANQAGFTNIAISSVSFWYSHAESWLLRRNIRREKRHHGLIHAEDGSSLWKSGDSRQFCAVDDGSAWRLLDAGRQTAECIRCLS